MAQKASFLLLLISIISHFLNLNAQHSTHHTQLTALLDLKSKLDPSSKHLSSWSMNGDPCGGLFEGVGCNELGQVANLSLQGKGIKGQLSPAIGALKHLTGLYLHYNSLFGEIPGEIGNLTMLSDLYLDVNNLSGSIPPQIATLKNLQVLQLGYNQLTGNIPTQLGSMNKLAVVALQYNQLTGAIPASLGDLPGLVRLDLSFNHLFGSVPTRLADVPLLEALDIRNNTLSGNVPPALKRLNEGFQYANNLGLCGAEFLDLSVCSAATNLGPQNRPEAYGEGNAVLPRKEIPETANVAQGCGHTTCPHAQKKSHAAAAVVVVVSAMVIFSALSVLSVAQYRRRKQKLGTGFDMCDNISQPDDVYRKKGSPLISLEYSNGWDPLGDGRSFGGSPQEIIQSFKFNLEEVESATQYFSPANLLGKSGFSAVYRGVLRNGSSVAIKRMSKNSCKSEEVEFLRGLNVLTSLRHENLVSLIGFCCSRGRGECFLIYDLVSNGSLLSYLDLEDEDAKVLEWSTRVSIINGVAKGIHYLHSYKVNKPPLVHQNISAEKVLLDEKFTPLISDSGINKLLTNDTVFSTLKASAAMGYLAPEYATIGRFTEKSDVYAFGILVFQILSGRRKITNSMRLAAESSKLEDFIDPNLDRRFTEREASKLAKVALSCTQDSPFERPSMDAILLELGSVYVSNCSRSP
ncbi:putative leucine-rich repeat receptor-like protein [Drosera capensis]